MLVVMLGAVFAPVISVGQVQRVRMAWTHEVDGSATSFDDDYAEFVGIQADGDCIVAGGVSEGDGNTDILVISIRPTGQVVWECRIDGGSLGDGLVRVVGMLPIVVTAQSWGGLSG